MVVFGSVYYHETGRAQLRSSCLGQFLEVLFVFWLYVLLRTWFPITRFKDARTYFSVYLVHIYLTFTAIPLAYEMFASHWKLCALCLGGLYCNMTRNRGIHALWCAFAMLLMCRRDYPEY